MLNMTRHADFTKLPETHRFTA